MLRLAVALSTFANVPRLCHAKDAGIRMSSVQIDFRSVPIPKYLQRLLATRIKRKIGAKFLQQLHGNSRRVSDSCLWRQLACHRQQTNHGPLDSSEPGVSTRYM